MSQIGKLHRLSQFRGLGILITILCGLFSVPTNSHEVSKHEVLPQVPVGGAFSLVDHTGRDVSDEDFKAFGHGVEIDELGHAIKEVLESQENIAESS